MVVQHRLLACARDRAEQSESGTSDAPLPAKGVGDATGASSAVISGGTVSSTHPEQLKLAYLPTRVRSGRVLATGRITAVDGVVHSRAMTSTAALPSGLLGVAFSRIPCKGRGATRFDSSVRYSTIERRRMTCEPTQEELDAEAYGAGPLAEPPAPPLNDLGSWLVREAIFGDEDYGSRGS